MTPERPPVLSELLASSGAGADTVEGMSPTLAWLRTRADDELVALLRARPDLTVPAPSDLGVLARRLDNPTSVHRAMEGLNALAVTVLAALTIAKTPRKPVTRQQLDAQLGPAADPGAIDAELDRLQALGLVRFDPEPAHGAPGFRVAESVGQALGPYPAGLGPPTDTDADQIAAALDAQDDAALGILRMLDRTSPHGICPPDAPAYRAVSTLVKAGLLLRVDAVTVELPREVGLALRGEHPIGPLPTPPEVPATRGDVTRVDTTAAGQGLASLQLVARLVADLGRRPVPALKSGGIGIRDLRRLAKDLDIDEHRAALILELLAAGGLITTDEPRSARGASWQPTALADEFADLTDEAAWVQLAQLWLDLRRDPAKAGTRGSPTPQSAAPPHRGPGHEEPARLTNVLAPELSWTRGPADRRFVLAALADLPPGAGVGGDQLTDYLAWRAPLRSAQRRAAVQAAVIAEGTWLGVIAFDAITSAGRALLAGDTAAAVAETAGALPPPVDQILVQADLTAIAPGRLTPTLAARMEQLADVESSGGATVYRITPTSIRRALDAGSSAADLHAVFAEHSATGVPQALEYLIDDTARRHGVLRIGVAGSYLRSDDAATLSEAVRAAEAAGFVLRRLAPTVAVSPADLTDLLEVLADDGIGVTAEDAGGSVVDVRPRPKRTKPSILTQQRRREPAVPADGQLSALVERMRNADQAAGTETGRAQTASESVALLRDAARLRHTVWIGYVDAEGTTSRRVVEPVVVSGGMLVAFDRLRSAMRSFALHRITEVTPDPTILPSESRRKTSDGATDLVAEPGVE